MNAVQKLIKFADTRRGQRILIGSAIGVLALAGLIGGYYWHVTSFNERAQKAFMDSMIEFEQALTGQEGVSWIDVERTFDTGSRTFAGSTFGPYFKVFQADAYVHQNKHTEAIKVMRDALAQLSPKNPLYFLYDTKLALMLLDSSDDVLHDEGSALLKSLADNTVNGYRDMALYYLGFYARAQDDQVSVQKYWQQLLQEFGSDSVWAEMVNAQREFAA